MDNLKYLAIGFALFELILPLVSAQEDYCYSLDVVEPQIVHMSTKTAYQLVRGRSKAIIPTGCTPSKFWLLARHGTRLPSSNQIKNLQGLYKYQEEILENYKKGNQPSTGALCDSDLQLLGDWRWNNSIHSVMDQYLTVQGWNDLKGIAQHYKTQYPGLLNHSYSPDKFTFRHTKTQRTQASYQGFVEGLFGENAHWNIPPPVVPPVDTLLKPFQYCPLYASLQNYESSNSSERMKFQSTPLYKQMIEDVSAKGGYVSPPPENVIYMWYQMCHFELAWNIGRKSPWCSLFTPDQIEILEYFSDLRQWFLKGPSTYLNSRLTCEAVQDMLNRLDSQQEPSVIAYFSHSTMVQLFLTALGFGSDDLPLLADNFEAQANRKWQTSQISPFATNVAAVRYDCATGPKVQFWLNEKPINFDWCTNGLCDLAAVKAKLAHVASQNCATYFCSE